jgi:predicted lipoprotein with Yx(FWY)xxD motif
LEAIAMIPMTRRPLIVLIFGAAVLLAACGSSGSSASGGSPTSSGDTTTTAGNGYGNPSGDTTTTAAPTTTAGGTAAAVVTSATTSLGATLVDADGHTLYEYQPDPSGKSTCTGGCATIWPPLTTSAATVSVGSGLTASLFTTVAGDNGAKVVAANGHALYRFSGDKNPGDTTGQGFGGIWHVAKPNGDPMM